MSEPVVEPNPAPHAEPLPPVPGQEYRSGSVPTSAAALPCPCCFGPMMVPDGIAEARCPRCQPELLWDAAKRVHEAREAAHGAH